MMPRERFGSGRTGTATFSTDAGQFADINGMDENSLPQEAEDNKPGGLTLPHGLFNFTITGLTPGQSVTLTVTLPSPVPMGSLWWKVNLTAGNNSWYSIPIGDDDGDNVVTITLTDGGLGDNDGLANGVIVDPSGIGTAAPEVIPATIDFDPDTLNLKSKGKWVTCYIELPEGYDIHDIDISTVELNFEVGGEYGEFNISYCMVKFDRQAVIDILPIGDSVEITVSGRLIDGTRFEGNDTIRVIDK